MLGPIVIKHQSGHPYELPFVTYRKVSLIIHVFFSSRNFLVQGYITYTSPPPPGPYRRPIPRLLMGS